MLRIHTVCFNRLTETNIANADIGNGMYEEIQKDANLSKYHAIQDMIKMDDWFDVGSVADRWGRQANK